MAVFVLDMHKRPLMLMGLACSPAKCIKLNSTYNLLT